MTAPVNISVLVPVYNVEPYLAQCLESICAQTVSYTHLTLPTN